MTTISTGQETIVFDVDTQTVTRFVDGRFDSQRAMTAEEVVIHAHPADVLNERTIRAQAAAALQANRTDKTTNDAYLAIASPTNAQNLAQIRELSRQSSRQARQLNQLIRQTYRLFDGTD